MTITALSRCLGAAGLLGAAWVLPFAPAGADSIGDFYKGKSISLLISVGAGDGMDLTARILARHWKTHLPGQPTFIPKNMPGAGHLRATNFLYDQAPKDGTVVGAIIPSFVMHQMLGGKSVNYDAAKFQWIGSTNASNAMIFVWHASGVKTLQDAMQKEVLLGGSGAGSNSVLYPAILNNLVGTKFKVVTGYKSTPEIDIAMERLEVQGRAGSTFNTLMANNPEWVTDKKLNILVQIGQDKEPGFENIPLMTEFAKDQASREVLRIFSGQITLGRPYLLPPDVPADRVAALRASFDAALKDPALLTDAKNARLDISPTSGDKLQKLVEAMINTDDAVVARMKAALETKGAIADKRKGGNSN